LPEDDEISLIDLAIALGEEKATILKVTGLFTALAVVASLLMTPIFTAKTVMMPPQQQQSGAASALASLGGLAGLAGAAAGIKSPDEMYVAFMQSEGLQKSIIEKLKLQDRYEAKTIFDTRNKLKEYVRISSDKKSGLITIEADDKDPAFSAQLANMHVDELRVLLGRLAVTDAQQRRMFYEQQIKKVQAELAHAEHTLTDLADGSEDLGEHLVQRLAAFRSFAEFGRERLQLIIGLLRDAGFEVVDLLEDRRDLLYVALAGVEKFAEEIHEVGNRKDGRAQFGPEVRKRGKPALRSVAIPLAAGRLGGSA
jgi:capsular polysaccharide biosynthesis protein